MISAKSLFPVSCLALFVGLVVDAAVYAAAQSTSNNGEFFDAASGAPVWSNLAILLTLWFVVSVLAVLGTYAVILAVRKLLAP